MTIKEQIHAEIERMADDSLESLFTLIKSFAPTRAIPAKGSIMAKLKKIRIEAPADFAANLDLYLSGEKRVEENLP